VLLLEEGLVGEAEEVDYGEGGEVSHHLTEAAHFCNVALWMRRRVTIKIGFEKWMARNLSL